MLTTEPPKAYDGHDGHSPQPDEIQITKLPMEETMDILRLRKINHGCYIRLFMLRGFAHKLVCWPPQNAFPMPCHCLTIAKDESRLCHKTPIRESRLERFSYLDGFYAIHGKFSESAARCSHQREKDRYEETPRGHVLG